MVWERFTDRAKAIMNFANQEARRYRHGYIGTEHILLGFLKEGSGVGANVLHNLGINLPHVRDEVTKVIKEGSDSDLPTPLPQSPLAKRVIELAIEEARNLNHNYVGSEHLLLGMLREAEGVAGQVLKKAGVEVNAARAGVVALLGG